MFELIIIFFLRPGHASATAVAAPQTCAIDLTVALDPGSSTRQEIQALEAKAAGLLSLILSELHPSDELVSALKRLDELDAAFSTSSGHFRQAILHNMAELISTVPEFGTFANSSASAKLAQSIVNRRLNLPGRPFGSRHAVLFVLYHQFSSVSSQCRIHMETLSTMAGQRSHLESLELISKPPSTQRGVK